MARFCHSGFPLQEMTCQRPAKPKAVRRERIFHTALGYRPNCPLLCQTFSVLTNYPPGASSLSYRIAG